MTSALPYQRAVIIGATSGIGRALAEALAAQGVRVGIAGRREAILAEMTAAHPDAFLPCPLDVSDPLEAQARLTELIGRLGGLDLLVLSAGIGEGNPDFAWEPQARLIAVNVTGFAALATTAYHYFAQQGSGHLAGISSVAGRRGSRWAPAYSASKAFVSTDLEALRVRARHDRLAMEITDLRPGFIATPMIARSRHTFWVISAEKAAAQILHALVRHPRVAYIPKRWAFFAWLLERLPAWVLERI